jgi:hypothetical protein
VTIRARILLFLLLIPSVGLGQLAVVETSRAWKSAEGKPFQAALINYDGTTVFFRLQNGRSAQLPATRLCPEDLQYLTDWKKRQPLAFKLPDVVGVDAAKLTITVVSEDSEAEKFIYRTPHFEFESQGKFTTTLLRQVARDFEATYELLKALPWNIDPKSTTGDFYRARLLKDQASYLAAGGVQNSAGIYLSKSATFLVPFESFGVKTVGTSYTKSEDFDSSTLVHELTHQLMHSWLDILPQWMTEGTAEYTSNLPLRTGRFHVASAKSGLKDYMSNLKQRYGKDVPDPYPLEKLLTISSSEWLNTLTEDPNSSSRLYYTSYLLVYYFMHLDGEGDGQRIGRYFHDLQPQRLEIEVYQKAMSDFFKKPGVALDTDGSYTYPSSLPHPKKPDIIVTPETETEFQKKMLTILLDGRSESELMEQIRSSYRRLGIKL